MTTELLKEKRAAILIKKGDNILVKASHGMEFPKVIEALKKL